MSMLIEYRTTDEFLAELKSGILKTQISNYIKIHKTEEEIFSNIGIKAISIENIFDFFEIVFNENDNYTCHDLKHSYDNPYVDTVKNLIQECFNELYHIDIGKNVSFQDVYSKLITIYSEEEMKKGKYLYELIKYDGIDKKQASRIFEVSNRAYLKTDDRISFDHIIDTIKNEYMQNNTSLKFIERMDPHNLIDGIIDGCIKRYIHQQYSYIQKQDEYSIKDWEKDKRFDALPGQKIAREVAEYLYNHLPPLNLPDCDVTNIYSSGFMVDEPFSFDEYGYPIHLAFGLNNEQYYFIGRLSKEGHLLDRDNKTVEDNEEDYEME